MPAPVVSLVGRTSFCCADGLVGRRQLIPPVEALTTGSFLLFHFDLLTGGLTEATLDDSDAERLTVEFSWHGRPGVAEATA